ncbi:cellulose biosynthesis protein BcsQ [Salinicola halimionae]|uniref:cellulose biosynthesis protein BcsQ n=1 Tax=Salinicola halimionae TaxID=1949081 RepID=UPI000DA1D5AC|nr:cellulose biosynthesis protein BcsQ [Salinicola halimionae]
MTLINLLSPKGGVGRTTLCANLGVALQQLGYRIVLVDLDPQNALRLHFQFPMGDERGLIDRFDSAGDWRHYLIGLTEGLELLPFGVASDAQWDRFVAMRALPGELSRRLRALAQGPNTLILVDSHAARVSASPALIDDADLNLLVLMADSGSVALLPRLEAQVGSLRRAGEEGRVGYLLNQVDTRARLKREITELMLNRLSPSLVGSVHRDEAIAEALAEQRSLFEQAPFSAAARDIEETARALAQRFPLRFSGLSSTGQSSTGQGSTGLGSGGWTSNERERF